MSSSIASLGLSESQGIIASVLLAILVGIVMWYCYEASDTASILIALIVFELSLAAFIPSKSKEAIWGAILIALFLLLLGVIGKMYRAFFGKPNITDPFKLSHMYDPDAI